MADGEDIRDLIPDDDRVRLVHVEGPICIGDKRNFGCGQAAGDIILHWDDDDYSAPGRIADQVERLQETSKPVTGYRFMRFTDGERWWLYEGEVNFALGTSLCYQKSYWSANNFPSKQIGEDNAFVRAAWDGGALTTVDAGDLMYATIHTGNTSPRNIGNNWKPL